MRPTKTLTTTLMASLLVLSACSEKSDDTAAPSNESAAAADASSVSAQADGSVPDISRAAPGVAFAYHYAFTLPAKAIADVQQEHASACARLGPDQCQITAMQFEQPREDEAFARLDLLLAPELAHQFGRDGIAAVEKAAGALGNASVSGENAGGAINESHQRGSVIKAELERIEGRLKASGLVKETRIELERRAEDLRAQLRNEGQERRQAEKSLASTPVSFSYASQGLIGTGSNPFGSAAKASWGSAETMLSVVLLVAGAALPWVILIALLVALWRSSFMRGLRGKGTVVAAPEGPTA